MPDTDIVHEIFTINRDGLSFSDALVMPRTLFESMTFEDIQAEKEKRFTNFKNYLASTAEQENHDD